MRVLACAILLCVLLGACGSKGPLVMPPKPGGEQAPATGNKPGWQPVGLRNFSPSAIP